MKKIVEKIGDAVHVNIHTRQSEFISSQLDDVFYGGAAGGGKTIAILLFAASRRMAFPMSQGLILRRTFRELENSLILESHKLYPTFGAVYNEQKKRWTFPNGAIQQFGYCEKDGDVYQYQSMNVDDICFDELTHWTEFQFTYLTSRCRTSIPGCKPLIRSASNPGNIGHVWVKKRYIDPSQQQKIWTHPVTGKTMAFIPAKLADNPALSENDPGYYNRLRELSEKKFLALAEGNWGVTEGTYFAEWDERRHILPYQRIPDTYTMKFISLDWGFADPACVLWWEILPSGRVFIYRELYINRLHPKELGEKILALSPEYEKYEYMAASPEIWGKSADLKEGGETIQQSLQAALGQRVTMIKAMNARVPGWLKCREWLGAANDGKPWLQVSPDCKDLIRTAPSAIHDIRPGHEEDIDPNVEDHALESMRYGVVSLMNVPRGTIRHPTMSAYDQIFGRKDEDPGNVSHLPDSGRSGYG